jgi:threonine aldolase
MLLGAEDVIAEAREWRHRHGGTLFNMWPYAAPALAGLRTRLQRMPAYVRHAQAIAAELTAVDGIAVVPDPPQTPMMHVYLRTTGAAVMDGIRRLAHQQKLWAFGGSVAADTPGYRRVELYAGDATLKFTPPEVSAAISQLLPIGTTG